MTPDEVRMLDNKYAILFVRGERPIKDFKYDILKHPNVKYTADGKGNLYEHGKTDNVVATINLDYDVNNSKVFNIEKIVNDYDIVSSEEMDDYLRKRGNKNEEIK